jgi:hypothetical protein
MNTYLTIVWFSKFKLVYWLHTTFKKNELDCDSKVLFNGHSRSQMAREVLLVSFVAAEYFLKEMKRQKRNFESEAPFFQCPTDWMCIATMGKMRASSFAFFQSCLFQHICTCIRGWFHDTYKAPDTLLWKKVHFYSTKFSDNLKAPLSSTKVGILYKNILCDPL